MSTLVRGAYQPLRTKGYVKLELPHQVYFNMIISVYEKVTKNATFSEWGL